MGKKTSSTGAGSLSGGFSPDPFETYATVKSDSIFSPKGSVGENSTKKMCLKFHHSNSAPLRKIRDPRLHENGHPDHSGVGGHVFSQLEFTSADTVDAAGIRW